MSTYWKPYEKQVLFSYYTRDLELRNTWSLDKYKKIQCYKESTDEIL